VHVRAGDSVVQGQRLVDLEQRDLLARAQQAREQIRALEARLVEAQQHRERVVALHRQGAVAAAELERAQAQFDALQAQLAAASQQLEEAETAVSFARIEAPINGVVVERFAEPGDTAAPGMRLLSLYNPLSLRIEAQVREQRVLNLALGDELAVEVPALNKRLLAQIEEIVPAAQPGSRSFLVKARIPFDEQLLPGMYAQMRVPAGQGQRLLIPRERLVEVGQLNLVWVLSDGQAYRRFVRVGQVDEAGFIEILSGLQPGEVVLMPPTLATAS
jgi:RND family efflux transporter MFP subunit